MAIGRIYFCRIGGENMKIRNEANRKVIDIIDSRIERNKKNQLLHQEEVVQKRCQYLLII